MASSSSPSRLTVGLAGFFLALIWFVPFNIQTHLRPILTFWSEWWAGAFLLSAAVLILAQRNDLTVKVPAIVYAFLGLTLVIAVQFGLRQLNFDAQFFAPAIYLIGAVIACCLGSTLRANGELERACIWIALLCLAGCMFNVFAQIAQLTQVDGYFPFISQRLDGYGLFGNVNQANHLASYLGGGLASVFYLRGSRQIGAIGMWSGLGFLTLGLVLTGQRSAMVYILMPLAVTLLAGSRLGNQRAFLLKATLMLPVLFVVMTVMVKLFVRLMDQDLVLPADAMATKSFYGERWFLWRHALAMFGAHPFLGIGFDQFWPEYFQQIDVLGGSLPFTSPHNLIAALLAETGFVGTLAVLVPLALWAWRTRLAAASMVQWFGLIQILNIGFHSMIEYPLWYSFFLIILSFWLGAMDPVTRSVILKKPQPLALLILVVTFVPMLNLATNYRRLQNDILYVPLTDVVDVATGNRPPYVKDYLEDIAKLSDHWLLHREVSFWTTQLIQVSPDHLADKLAANARGMKVLPNIIVFYRQVLLLILDGKADEAIHLLSKAQKVYSRDYSAMIAALLMDAKRWPVQFEPAMQRLRSLDQALPQDNVE